MLLLLLLLLLFLLLIFVGLGLRVFLFILNLWRPVSPLVISFAFVRLKMFMPKWLMLPLVLIPLNLPRSRALSALTFLPIMRVVMLRVLIAIVILLISVFEVAVSALLPPAVCSVFAIFVLFHGDKSKCRTCLYTLLFIELPKLYHQINGLMF